jgi:hypothetical protein
MVCSKLTQKTTGIVHVIALVITFAGMAFQIYSVNSGNPYALWLPISLAIMMLLRIPNQICVALHESHGWYSVVGSSLGLIGYIALTIVTFQKSKTDKDEQTPPAILLNKQQQSFV